MELRKYIVMTSEPHPELRELVRCKDCVHNVANKMKDLDDRAPYMDIVCDFFEVDGMEPDDYCSHAEKTEGEEHEGLMIMNSRTREDVGDVPDEDVVITDLVEDGKVIVVDRDDFEDWLEEIMDECEED